MPLGVFISHSVGTEELPLVHHLSAALTGAGIQPYLALYDRQPGTYLSTKVQANITRSDILLVLVTKKGAESKWLHEEIGYAIGKGRKIVPFVEAGVDARQMLEGREYYEFDPNAPTNGVDVMASYLRWIQSQQELAEARATAENAELRVQQAELLAAIVVIGAILILAIALSRE
jgi:nucleoside 2-deoxyribosyltransferase